MFLGPVCVHLSVPVNRRTVVPLCLSDSTLYTLKFNATIFTIMEKGQKSTQMRLHRVPDHNSLQTQTVGKCTH